MHRKFQEHAIFQEAHRFRLAMFCIANANYVARKWTIPGTLVVVDVPRGSFITGRHKLHADLYPQAKAEDPSPSKLWRILSLLAELKFVKLKNLNNRASMVSVVNYETYQSEGSEGWTAAGQPVDNRRTAAEHYIRKQERKEDIGESKKRKCKTRKTCETAESERYLDFPASDGTFWLSNQQKQELQAHWKNVDIPEALKAIKGWCITAGDDRKTCRGMLKFIGGWINRGVTNKSIKLLPASKCPTFEELLNPRIAG